VDSIRIILQSNDLVAVLGREIAVRLVNISGSGCLVVTTSPLHEGATASLRMEFGGVEYGDDVRVARCTRLEGSSEYHLGLEFLWTTAPGERSMRRMVDSLRSARKETVVEFAKPGLAERRTVGRHSRS
jgi:hypothetical protein